MTTRKIAKVSANLCKKGFVRRETHHSYFELVVDGRKTNVSTFMSHGKKEIDDHLITAMADQLKVNKRQFLDFVDCIMTQEEYVQILRDGNKLILRDACRA